MPRKRRPTPPAPGSIPVRNIAPKPDSEGPNSIRLKTERSIDQVSLRTSSSSQQSTNESDTEVAGSCGVPQCTTPRCRLATHWDYGKQRRALLLQQVHQSWSSPTLNEATSELTLQTSPESSQDLPLIDTPAGELQRLFTNFFVLNGSFDRLILIARPSQQHDHSVKQTAYQLALGNALYCLTIIAFAHVEVANLKDPQAMQLTDTIYTRLLTMAREKVSGLDSDKEADIDILLCAIVTLCIYDLRLDRHNALRSHHIGMTALVAKAGGIHNLGRSLPYVLRMDRFLAIRSNQVPQFSSPELATSEIPGPQQANTVTNLGASFRNDSSSSLSKSVHTLCNSAASLLALMDDLNITFDLTRNSDTTNPKLEYFYYLRENIEARHALLNYELYTTLESTPQNPNEPATINIRKDLCSITAMRIITYYIATDNFLPIVTETLSTRLWSLLTKPQSSNTPPHRPDPTINLADWTNDMPLLLWFLFACALPDSRNGPLTFVDHLDLQLSTVSHHPIHDVSLTQTRSQLPIPPTPTAPTPQTPLAQIHPSSYQSASPPQNNKNYYNNYITSPSSPRRQTSIPTLILHVSEHLIGERPLSGTHDWDAEVLRILEGFVWSRRRLEAEFGRVVDRVHGLVLERAGEEW